MIFYNSRVEISRSALLNNLRIFKKIIGPKVRLMAVVKSNAYGHGLFEVSKILDRQLEVDFLATASLAEALFLRKTGVKKPLFVLSFYDLEKPAVIQAIRQDIRLVVYNLNQAKFINQIARSLKKKAKIHFKVDTGTSRLGILVSGALRFIKQLLTFPNLELEGIFTHYAASEEKNKSFTIKQTKLFQRLIKTLEKQNIVIPLKHVACSAATLADKRYHFNAVRPGLSLYGLWSFEDGKAIRKKYHLQPALSWKTRIIQVKNLPAGATVGYGRTYLAKKKIKMAILPVGYWDGYDRKLSGRPLGSARGRGEVLVSGRRCKVLGRVCMNLIMVDVSGIPAKVGDDAVLIGRQGSGEITVDELAEKTGTINYEVVTRINPLIMRKVIR